MADFSLTTLFVVPKAQVALPAALTSTQDLGAGVVGLFTSDYKVADTGTIVSSPYFYIAQGRVNNYLQGSIRSDKIRGCLTPSCNTNVTEFYKVFGCANSTTQITEVSNWTVQCGDVVTLTLRAHSSYLDTLYFNGFTRSVTVQAPCCDCIGDACANVDDVKLVNQLIAKLTQQAPGNNPDNINLNQFFTFTQSGAIGSSKLIITGKPLTKYAQPCDIAAFPHEYDRMWFRTFVYEGPATTADFIVADSCNLVANPTVVQRASYPIGTAAEIKQLEKNFYSYQAGYLKHLYRMAGYNENYDSNVDDAATYDTYYLKYNEYDRSAYQWGDYIPEDQMAIIAVDNTKTTLITALELLLAAGLGATLASVTLNAVCPTTTTTTTGVAPSTTTTTSTLFP